MAEGTAVENEPGTSARLGLPLLAAGQAQKELTHNEALTLLDIAVQPAVGAVGLDVPPIAPAAGETWIAGAAPGGAWTGRARSLASWTAGGWRFVAPRDGMAAWSIADAAPVRFAGGAWHVLAPVPPIADPAGGAAIDGEARGAIAAMLMALRRHGLVAP